jgi:hypothetical protein
MTKVLSKEDCNRLFLSKTQNPRGDVGFINPKTKRFIKEDGRLYKYYMQDCNIKLKKERTEIFVQQWIENPLINPINGKKIKIYLFEHSEYTKLYDLSYSNFLSKNKTNRQIIDLLPKNHLIFNKYDVLFIRKNLKDIPIDQYDMHKLVHTSYNKYGDFYNVVKYFKYPVNLHKNNSQNEKILMYIFVETFCNVVADYMSQVYWSFISFDKIYNKFGNSIFFKIQTFHHINQFNILYHTYPMFFELFQKMHKKLIKNNLDKKATNMIPLKDFCNVLFKDSKNVIETYITARNEMIEFIEAGNPYSVKTEYLKKLFELLYMQ